MHTLNATPAAEWTIHEHLARAWRGESRLLDGFWLGLIVIHHILVGGAKVLLTLVPVAMPMGSLFYNLIVRSIVALIALLNTFFAVSVCRAASRYEGPRGWAYAAQFVLALLVLVDLDQTLQILFL